MRFKLWLEARKPPVMMVNGVQFVKPARAVGDSLLLGDIRKIDASFAKDRNFYVGAKGAGGIGGRYEGFQEFLAKKVPIEAPEVGVDHGRIYFINGRHRYAVFRDMNWPAMPFSVNRSSLRAFKSLFLYQAGL